MLFSFSATAAAQVLYLPNNENFGTAYCINLQTGEVVPDCDVTLANGVYFVQNQHNHNSPAPPVSSVIPLSGNTGCCGLPVAIRTTKVGQVEWLAVCADYCSVTDIYVGYPDLVELTSGSNWVLIGQTSSHPINHFGTPPTVNGIKAVASQYRSEYPQYPVIAINDIALPLAGIFDLNRNWQGPHFSHRQGKAVDIRGNGGPNSVPKIPSVQARFREICLEKGATRALHESIGTTNEHFHCQWP
ncbi:hypothetical protein [Microbulbifer sp. TYP-18]|uniref:hypothetical protein n=1 Tax=Microbulbifer sp. TYP-18 TaxID=3230024 RepID=UPI0034C67D2F